MSFKQAAGRLARVLDCDSKHGSLYEHHTLHEVLGVGKERGRRGIAQALPKIEGKLLVVLRSKADWPTQRREARCPISATALYGGLFLPAGGCAAWYYAFMMLTFRTAFLPEGEEIERIIRAAFTPYIRALGRELPTAGSAGFAEGWERFVGELERGEVYVGLDSERIIGAVRTKPQEKDLCIQQIAVDPTRQGTGVGSWLLKRIEEMARARSLGSLSLETAEMAVANIRLYQRHGFEIVSRGPPEHGLDLHTRVYMAKPL